MIASIIRSKTYLLSLPPLERASAVEAYALSLKSTFKAMALVGVLALVAAWPIEERALGTVLLVFCMSAYLADIPIGGRLHNFVFCFRSRRRTSWWRRRPRRRPSNTRRRHRAGTRSRSGRRRHGSRDERGTGRRRQRRRRRALCGGRRRLGVENGRRWSGVRVVSSGRPGAVIEMSALTDASCGAGRILRLSFVAASRAYACEWPRCLWASPTAAAGCPRRPACLGSFLHAYSSRSGGR